MPEHSITIPLTRGYEAIIDAADAELVRRSKWYANTTTQGYVYAMAYAGTGRQGNRKLYLHRVIMGVTDRAIHVDHLNGNTLDNRRENLNATDNQGNLTNTKHRRRIAKLEAEVARLQAILSAHGLPYDS